MAADPMDEEPVFKPCFVDAIAVSVHDWFFDEDHSSTAAEVLAAIESLPGRYWRIASSPFFRQELPADPTAPNNKALVLHWVEKKGAEGWYVSEDPSSSDHVAWGPDGASGHWPDKLHVPFWAKKACQALKIEPLHTWSETRIGSLGEQLLAAQSTLEAAEDEAPRSGKGKGKDKDKGKGKDKGKNKGGSGSGWLNKMVPLLAAIQSGDMTAASILCEEYSAHPVMAPLLARHIAKSG